MLPTDMIWTILVLLPKVNTYTCGIGLLLVLWKAVEDIIYTHINMAVMFNDVLHGFCACRGTGTANTELKMAQELASTNKDPLFLVFLDIRKAYDALDLGRLLHILEGYGAGSKMQGILAEFWENQEVVTRHKSYHDPQFRATQGTTQGGLVSPIVLNVAVDRLVRHWL